MPDETPGSVQGYILGALREKVASEIEKVPVPRFGGRLVLRCQAVDSRTRIAMGLSTNEADDPVQGIIDASIDGLLAACVGSETDRGEDLGAKLGVELATMLGLTEGLEHPVNDREAVYLIFEDEAEIVEAAVSLAKFQDVAQQKASDDVLGKSSEGA